MMVLHDMSLTLRLFRSRSGYAFGVIVMHVVGISLTTAMFALGDPFLTRPLPYAQPDRLVRIDIDLLRIAKPSGDGEPGYPLLRDWQARTDLFDGLAAFERREPLRVRLTDRVVALEAMSVSANFFAVLGVPATRPLTPGTTGDEVWLTSRGAKGLTAGTTGVLLSLQPAGSLHVTGELGPSFLMPEIGERADVDALLELPPGSIASTQGGITTRLTLIGRLRDGRGPVEVEHTLNAVALRQRFAVKVTSLPRAMKAPGHSLAVGALVAGLLLLTVCAANTFGMALTRGLYRAHEMATMQLLGASRMRLARLQLAEAVCLAALGTLGALVLTHFLFSFMVAMLPRNLLVLGGPQLSVRTAAFAGLAGLLACTAWWMGSLAAWFGVFRGRTAGDRTRYGRLVRLTRFGLIAVQTAVTLTLVTGAGLLARSYLNLVRQDTGMSGETLALSVSYGPELTGAKLQDTISRAIHDLRYLPGVRLAAAAVGEMADGFNITAMIVVDRPAPVELLWVSPDYFAASGMTLVDGRALADSDGRGRGVVINEALVSRLLGGRVAIGQLIQVGSAPSIVVGIVKNSRRRALDESPRPAVFRVLDETVPGIHVTYLVSGTDDMAAVFERVMYRVSSDAVVLDAATLRARLSRTILDRSFAALVIVLFAAATITVTALGIVSVVSYNVARRTREMGIRLAIGATSSKVTWLAMREACMAVAVGALIGMAGVLWLSDIVSSLLYQVPPRDVATLMFTMSAVFAVSAAAATVPARRAGRLSPVTALRHE